jgi:acyl-CoA synthetase (AMP-forming)/AMP-acid ligase II
MNWNLADLFEAVVDAIGEREALVCDGRRLTYAELDQRANRLAHHLTDAGVQPHQHVGIQAQNSSEYLETAFACFKIRAVPININYRYVADELRYLYDNADLVALVFQRQFADRVAVAAPHAPALRHLVAIDDDSGADLAGLDAVVYDEAIAATSPERDFPPRSGDDIYVIYTGGTTGMPKGVMWRQEDLFFAGMGGGNPQGEPLKQPDDVTASVLGRQPGVTFPVAPLMHGAAQLASHISFNWGDKVVLLPTFSAAGVWDLVEQEGVNTVSLVGDAMARPMAEALEADPDRWDLSSLVVVSSAGAILTGTVKDLLTAHLPNTFILDSFGSSETGFQGMASGDSSPEKGLRFTMNERVAVLSEDRRILEPGDEEVGFVAQRGHIPLGYYGDEEKTKKTFWEVDGERWVVPGDFAQVDADGVIHVLGRGSVCINTGGEKVFPEEVEAALKSHADVYDAAVVGVPDERWGERVTALIQPRPGAEPEPDDVIAHARTKVAGYKAPRQVWFVDDLVRSPNGKLDYPWARKEAASRAGIDASTG